MDISIDQDKCTACGRCAQACRTNFVQQPGAKPRVAQPLGPCILCGHCAASCPSGAIAHAGLSRLAFDPAAVRPGFEQLMDLLKLRRSRREFTPQQVGRPEIDSMLLAAAQAPNGINRRNVGYVVITDPAVLAELSRRVCAQLIRMAGWLERPAGRLLLKAFLGTGFKELEPLLPLFKPMVEAARAGEDVVLYKAPCAIVIHTGRHDPCGAEDGVYCGANILLAAEALGLGACVVGFLTEPINRDKGLRALARVPDGRVARTSIIVGHPRFPYAQGIGRPLPQAVYV